jgi:quinol-cytochrome oxidoreductase complex cytochrome b subunit
MLGMLWMVDPVVPVHGMLSIYSTTSNLTVAYNVGATAGVSYALQVSSGLVIAMSYVASDAMSFCTLDALRMSTGGILSTHPRDAMNLEVSRYSGNLSLLWGCGYHLIWLLVGHLSV